MRKWILIPMLLLAIPFVDEMLLKAQTLSPVVLANGGLYRENGGYSLSATMGEAVVKTVSTGPGATPSRTLTQGFQQPADVLVSVEEPLPAGWDAMVYPNPFNEEVFVRVEGTPGEKYKIGIYNMLGQEVFAPVQQIEEGSRMVFLVRTDELALGPYNMLIIPEKNDQNLLKVKIIKVR